MGGLALFSLFWLAPNVVPFILLLTLTGSNLRVLMLRPQRRIHHEKVEELERLWVAIRADQEALLAGEGAAGSGTAAARLPALYTAEARTAAVREWPFDTSSVIRFAV
jgi:hypothetical protein